MLAPGSQG